MTLKILSLKEKAKIERKLQEQFGIDKMKGIIVKIGAEKMFLFQGAFGVQEMVELERTVPVDKVGVYFAKIQKNEIRLSMEGTQVLGKQITKNIFELNKKQAETWMQGSEINVASGMKGFVALKFGNDFLGCGKASAEKITNFIPKNRRLKSKDVV